MTPTPFPQPSLAETAERAMQHYAARDKRPPAHFENARKRPSPIIAFDRRTREMERLYVSKQKVAPDDEVHLPGMFWCIIGLLVLGAVVFIEQAAKQLLAWKS